MLTKITEEEHSDWCLCFDCNEGFLKGDVKISNKTSKVTKFKHAKDCMCVSCVADRNAAENQKAGIVTDHTKDCICYKCKKDKDMGKTGGVMNASLSGSSITSYKAPVSTYTACHDGNVHVFTKDGVSIYGAGNLKDAEPNKVDLVLDLDRNVRAATWETDLPKHFKSRLRASSNVRVLDLFIKDMHAPEHVSAEFWVDFWQDLVAEAKKLGGKIKVLVMCQGGHGRTGVVITSLIMASAYNKKNIPEDVHPVGWLRKNYCNKAVESLRQTDYLTRVWGLRFVSASKGSGSYTSYNTSTENSETKTPKQEIPDENSVCCECKTKRTADNRILFSGDIKEFECDRCFSLRADDSEKDDKDIEVKDGYDNTEPCDGEGCYDNYNDMTDSWTTIHTYDKGCQIDDGNCGGEYCGYHSNSLSVGIVHTFDKGCNAKEGEVREPTINEMTEAEWIKSLL